MSKYYNPKRTRNVYQINSEKIFKLSRSKIDLFLNCPRCFYLDRKLGVGQPPGFPFALNSAVDALLKKEFDIYRAKGIKHPLIEKYNIDAKPVFHNELEKWRQNFTGIQYLHQPTNFLVFGAIDDLWQNSNNEFIVVDYKEITELNEDWQIGYKRQMEIYQWLLRQNGFEVSNIGYFVYCNGQSRVERFDGKLEFDITLISYEGNDNWVEKTIFEIHEVLQGNQIPPPSPECDFCAYRKSAEEAEKQN